MRSRTWQACWPCYAPLSVPPSSPGTPALHFVCMLTNICVHAELSPIHMRRLMFCKLWATQSVAADGDCIPHHIRYGILQTTTQVMTLQGSSTDLCLQVCQGGLPKNDGSVAARLCHTPACSCNSPSHF